MWATPARAQIVFKVGMVHTYIFCSLCVHSLFHFDIFHFDSYLLFHSVNIIIWHWYSLFFVIKNIPQCLWGAKSGILSSSLCSFSDPHVPSLQGVGVYIFTRVLKTSPYYCISSHCSWVLTEVLVSFFKIWILNFCFCSASLFSFKTCFWLSLYRGDQRQELLALPMETQADHTPQEPQALLESGKE